MEQNNKRISCEEILEYQMMENAYHINKYEHEDFLLAYCLCELADGSGSNVFKDNRKYFSRKVKDRAKCILRYYDYLYGDIEHDSNMLSHLRRFITDYQKQFKTDERLFFIVCEDDSGELRIIKDRWTSIKCTSNIGKCTRKRMGFVSKLLAEAKLKYYQDSRETSKFVLDPKNYRIIELPYKE